MTDLTVVPPVETTSRQPYDQDQPESFDLDTPAMIRILNRPEVYGVALLADLVALVQALAAHPLSEATRVWYMRHIMEGIEATK